MYGLCQNRAIAAAYYYQNPHLVNVNLQFQTPTCELSLIEWYVVKGSAKSKEVSKGKWVLI